MAARKLQFNVFDDQLATFEKFKALANVRGDSEALRLLLDIAFATDAGQNIDKALWRAGYREGAVVGLAKVREKVSSAFHEIMQEAEP